MAEDARPKLVQIPQGRDTTPHAVKSEDEEEDQHLRPKPLQFANGSGSGSSGSGAGSGNGNGNTVTLPSFREAYGPALGAFPPQPPPSHHDIGRPTPGPRPYPESPNSMGRPPANYTSPPPPGPPGLPGPASYRTSPHGHSHYGPPPPIQHGPPGSVPPPGPHGPPGHPGHPGPPGHSGPPPGHERSDSYGRPHPPPDQSYQDSKEYYAYQQQQYGHYAERPPPQQGYWAHMPPNYQPAPPETAPRQRTSIACKYCRKRKIRCSGYQNTPDGKCTNCKKTGNDCVFQPVSSTTSTAFVPVSAIQGGVPPGTPLFGAFGQPLGPNGGRGPSNAPPYPGPGYVPASPGRGGGYYHPEPNGPHGPHGPPPPQHMQQPPPHPQHQPYPQHPQHPQHQPHPQHPQHPQHQPHPQHPQHPQHPPHPQHMPPQQHPQHPQHQQQPSHGPPPPLGPRHLPLPLPQPHPGYSGEESRRLSMSKRSREDEDMGYPPRLRPPPPGPPGPPHAAAAPEFGYYRGAEDARRSPPMTHGPGPAPGSAGSTSSIPPRGYGTPAPPVLPQPPLSSVGTDTSDRSNSFSGTDITSPLEWRGTSSPSDNAGDRTSHAGADCASPSYPLVARDFDSSAGREIDRTMLKRLGSARPGSHSDSSAEQKTPPHLLERA